MDVLRSMIALVLLAGVGSEGTGAVPRTSRFPVRFESEVVRLFVEPDSVRVEGLYVFRCAPSDAPPRAPEATVVLLYPYPADSLLGGARTLRLEGRVPPGDWEPLAFRELPHLPAVRWQVPFHPGGRVEVRTTYRQARHARYARYIVTTTRAWDEPLRTARFEVYLPESALPTRFSLPFHPEILGGRVVHVHEASDFAPREDVVVEWRDGPGTDGS